MDPNVSTTPWGQKRVDDLRNAVSSCVVWSQVEANTPSRLVRGVGAAIREVRPEVVIAIGGGSTIDLAKSAVAISDTALTLDALVEGVGLPDNLTPIIAIPTTCGTGSEASPFAVILFEEQQRKRGFRSRSIVPKEVYLDSDALTSLPPQYVAATGIDAICHSVETYLSTKGTPFSRCCSVGPMLTGFLNLRPAINADYNARDALLSASFTSRLLSPTIGLTIAHAISHPLGALTGIHHGTTVAMTIIPACRMNLPFATARFAELARLLDSSCAGIKDAEASVCFLNKMESLIFSLPLELPKLNLSDLDVEQIARQSLASSNVPSNPAPVELKSMIRVVSECLL